ncbi:Ldh family oxidoreductase [Pararhizobium sp. YC-54]|uniref:Ldh family oxidoreductase n=1 Tax=Pararhizobium sp. YC-54 TaxID=2986920 RepID=UPI0021F6C7B1|nr:Ldh family oxidoreductase [Pararhizobium sp. YC-54]MCV9996636.1 Ldh family oxidoreductase [Pararhizobium sp. YC-54]
MSAPVLLQLAAAQELATRACTAVSADEASTRSLVNATMSASLHGPPTLGFPHLVDYLRSYQEGRINRNPNPRHERPMPALISADADGGIAQLGFDLAVSSLVETAKTIGTGIFSQRNSYTTGELGYYVRRLAEHGIVSIAATNAHAMMTPSPGGKTVYSTNPLAFGFPLGDGVPPLVIDQSSSATAFVNVAAAAAEGRPIPEGWAVDKDGNATQDATAALAGALLPFGDRKGANLALMVEMLSAGLSGGAWSMDASNFQSGSSSPAVGLTVFAIIPAGLGDDMIKRANAHVKRLQDNGVYVPGVSSDRIGKPLPDSVDIPGDVYETIKDIIGDR